MGSRLARRRRYGCCAVVGDLEPDRLNPAPRQRHAEEPLALPVIQDRRPDDELVIFLDLCPVQEGPLVWPRRVRNPQAENLPKGREQHHGCLGGMNALTQVVAIKGVVRVDRSFGRSLSYPLYYHYLRIVALLSMIPTQYPLSWMCTLHSEV